MIQLPPHDYGLYLTHNEHKDYYQTALEWITDQELLNHHDGWSSPGARQRCIDTNEIWDLQWYPNTPLGFYRITGPTLEEVLAAAEERKK